VSHLVHELNWVVERSLVVAPSSLELKGLMEYLTFDLTTRMAIDQKLDLKMCSLPGAVETFCSFTLGKRSNAPFRMMISGTSFENTLTQAHWDLADHVVLALDPKSPASEKLFRLKLSEDMREKPLIAAGLGLVPGNEPSLRHLALIEWLSRNFSNLYFIPTPQEYFAKGLEWALSF
jgi:hypothetical protein